LRKLAEIAEAQAFKGEIVLVVGPAETTTISDEVIDARLGQALDIMSLKDAAKALADELGIPKARIYALGLKAKDKRP
jgi:16S rRNA (cytidine1402-2'-O)-methyltransferase